MDKRQRLLALVVIAAAGALGLWLGMTFISSGEPDSGLGYQFARPKESGTPVYHVWVGEQWRPIIGEGNWQKNIVDDLDSTAVTDQTAFRDFAVAFQDFPLYWLGLEFEGLPLTRVTLSYRPQLTPPEHHVVLSYGTCTFGGQQSCSVPLQIRVEPYCLAQPGMFAPEAKEGAVFQVRGADAQYISEALRIWTGPVAVRVSAYSRERAEQVAEALVAANGQGQPNAAQPLAPADTDCSDFTLEPYSDASE